MGHGGVYNFQITWTKTFLEVKNCEKNLCFQKGLKRGNVVQLWNVPCLMATENAARYEQKISSSAPDWK